MLNSVSLKLRVNVFMGYVFVCVCLIEILRLRVVLFVCLAVVCHFLSKVVFTNKIKLYLCDSIKTFLWSVRYMEGVSREINYIQAL